MAMTANGLAKLIEECGELQQICGKKLAYFYTDNHPDGGSFKARMEEEIADVAAASSFVAHAFGLDHRRIDNIVAEKLRRHLEKHEEKAA